MSAGDIIRQHRLCAGLTQTSLALRLDVRTRDVSNWENNRTRPGRMTATVLDDVVEAHGYLLTILGYNDDAPDLVVRVAALESEVARLKAMIVSLLST